MPEHPESFPVNALVPIKGTPLEDNEVSSILYRALRGRRSKLCLACKTPYTLTNHCYRTSCYA